MATTNHQNTPGRTGKIIEFLKSETFSFGVGLILVIFSVYMLLAFLSFFFTGAADQSIVESGVPEDLSAVDNQVKNYAGSRGAQIANILINRSFGIASFAILIFLCIAGLHLMKVRHFNLWRWFIGCSLSMIWLSVFLGFVFIPYYENSFIYAGGLHGYNVAVWLISQIGNPGVWLLLLAIGILFFVFISRQTVIWVRKLLRFEYMHSAEKNENEEDRFEKNETNTPNISKAEITEEASENQETEPKASAKGSFFSRFSLKKNKKTSQTDKPAAPAEEPEHPEQPQQSGETDEKNNSKSFELNLEVNQPAVSEKKKAYEPTQNTPDIALTFENPTNEPEKTDNNPTHKSPTATIEPNFEIESPKQEEDYTAVNSEPYNPRLDLPGYQFPNIDLMKRYDNDEPVINMEEQNANKDKIIQTLGSFGIAISTIRATVGPTVTLYEITPEQGVRISKIRGLEDDIALSLSALGIRIIAPIPGKGTIGIEVPNSKPRIVSGQSIIGSKKFRESTYELPIALGKTITNEVFMVDLCKMPHVLVAGATGQGKSVGLNTIITSLLYKKHPSELKFVLVDPKKVEFSIYSVIEKHYLAKLPDEGDAIITDVTKVVQTLNSVCIEMDTRYDLLKMAHVRNIKEYNEKFINRRLNPEKGHKFMPYIVVIIDEFGDLIMTAGKEIELPIARIAQLARAVGIHMVIATQRPTTNIITGTIKANFPARIAFRVSSMMDSRTILDRPGANQLIGRGDMLFLQGADPVRVQCAFIDTPEVEEITHFIAKQPGYSTAFFLPEYVGEDSGSDLDDVDMGRLDSLFEDAARLIVIHQQGSTSLIQRKFSIGYNRAGRIMDQLEKAGIVGPAQGSKPRDVLCIDENDLENRLNNLR